MSRIFLRGGFGIIEMMRRDARVVEAIIDVGDIELVDWYSWRVQDVSTGNRYVVTGNQNHGKTYLHHLLAGRPQRGGHIDHINGNGLDNRRANLRVVSVSGNLQNQRRLRRDNTSGFRGVVWSREMGRWKAQWGRGGTTHSVGYFDTPEAADEAVREARERFMPYSPEAREVA